MIKVTIEVMSMLQDDFNYKSSDSPVLAEVVSPGTSIMDLIRLMVDKYPKFGKKAFDVQKQVLTDYCGVMLNGNFVFTSAQLNMELKEEDTVTFYPAFTC